MDELEKTYHQGYLASSIEVCPHKKNTDEYKEWMRGYHDHQHHRERVAQLAAKTDCGNPLYFQRF